MTAQPCHNPRTSHNPGSYPASPGDAVRESLIARAAAQRQRASASHDAHYLPRTTLIANVVAGGLR
jgi:hypothetical protein